MFADSLGVRSGALQSKLVRTPRNCGFNASEDVYPGYPGIIACEKDEQRILQSMTWGLRRHAINKRTGKPNKPEPVNNLLKLHS